MATFGSQSTDNVYDLPMSSGNWLAVKYTLSEAADVSSASFRAKYVSAAQAFRVAIFEDAGGSIMGNLVFITAEFVVTSAMTAYAWRTANRYGGGVSTLSPADYWIMLWPGSTGEGANVPLVAWSGVPAAWKDGETYSATGNPTTPMTGEATTTYGPALYATYTVPAAGISIPLLNHLLLGD